MLVLLPKVAIGYNRGFREKNNQILKKNKEKKTSQNLFQSFWNILFSKNIFLVVEFLDLEFFLLNFFFDFFFFAHTT